MIMKMIKRLIDVKRWKRSSKTAAITIMAAVVLIGILSAIKLSKEEMMDYASDRI